MQVLAAERGLIDRDTMRLLIVEDHPAMRNSLRMFFTVHGVEHIGCTCNAEEALAAIEAGQVDVVLLDIDRPSRSALEDLQQLKEASENIPIVVLSYDATPGALSLCFHCGAAGYIKKSDCLAQLMQAMERVPHGESLWTHEQKQVVHTFSPKPPFRLPRSHSTTA